MAPVGQPVSIATDRQHRRLFLAGRNASLPVTMDADSGRSIGSPFPIGAGVDTNVYDPETGVGASSTGDGARDPKTHDLPVDTADFDPPAAGAAQRKAKPGTFHLPIHGS